MELSLDLNRRYTYADYLTWLDDKRRELINGVIRLMTAAPSSRHQVVCGKLITSFSNLIEKHKGRCEVFPAPFDVRLPINGQDSDEQIIDVVQPDICVVCDSSKIDDKGCLGAPDLVAEIISPSSIKYDANDKFNLYEASGVREYWIVMPFEDTVTAFLLQPDGKYNKGTTYRKGKIPVHIFNDYEIDLDKVF